MKDKDLWYRQAIERFERPLVAYSLRMCGDLERAREITQEAFLRLWQAGERETQDHLAPWLFTVCRNLAIDRSRKEQRMEPASELKLARVPDRGPGPSEVLEQRQEQEQIRSCLTMLPENQQEVLRLKFQQGLSYREISQVTGLTESNVGFLIHTGIRGLRDLLATGT